MKRKKRKERIIAYHCLKCGLIVGTEEEIEEHLRKEHGGEEM